MDAEPEEFVGQAYSNAPIAGGRAPKSPSSGAVLISTDSKDSGLWLWQGEAPPTPALPRPKSHARRSEEDKRQGTYTTSICALAKKDHPNHRGSRGGDPDEACVDRCRREMLNGFGQQVIYGNGAEHTNQQRCPSREWRGPFQNERPCDFEKICEKDEEPRLGPRVCGLTAGGNRIRTVGPARHELSWRALSLGIR
jgi:hypothetical protein